MASCSQALVLVLASGVQLSADPGPVVEGVPHPGIARLAHDDGSRLTALPGNRRNTGIGAESVIISLGKRLRGLCKHRGGNPPTDSG